jgi:alkylation response protein AidB-like acyl-CoA dehydrogenase
LTRETSGRADEILADARAWLDQHATRREGASEGHFSLEEAKSWQSRLHDQGLVGMAFPATYGGQDLPETLAREIEALLHQYELPFEYFAIGLGMCAPTLLALGTEHQRRRYLRPLLRGEEIWCQLFSEPGAGSDVASLQTRAVRSGGGWVVNGQKVWSSGAHHSDLGLLLARTDPDVPKHRGITMFVLDLGKPGVTVRPLQQITGRSRFNEVFFNDVELSDADIVGGLNEGWSAAVSTLNFERVSVAGWDWNRSARLTAASLRDRAVERGAILTSADRRRLAELYASQALVESLIQVQKEESEAGSFQPARGSVTKLAESWHKNLCVDVACAVAGFDLLAEPPDGSDAGRLLTDVLATRGSLIAGGTDEIQKNIVGERVLGLPPEIRVDKDVPFRDLTVGTRRHSGVGTAPEE